MISLSQNLGPANLGGLVELNLILSGGAVGPVAPALLWRWSAHRGHRGQNYRHCYNQSHHQNHRHHHHQEHCIFLLREPVDVKLAVGVTTGAHLGERRLSGEDDGDCDGGACGDVDGGGGGGGGFDGGGGGVDGDDPL